MFYNQDMKEHFDFHSLDLGEPRTQKRSWNIPISLQFNQMTTISLTYIIKGTEGERWDM